MITIVDYGMGNLGSIYNMLKRIGEEAVITPDPEVVARASKILLPGVGAFDNAMTRINESGLRDVLDRKALVEKVPILGICLGMQIITRSSEEGRLAGLGWVAGSAKRFPSGAGLKVPHMGWNIVMPARESPLTRELPADPRFYFVHSYYVQADRSEDVILKSTYGVSFDSAIQHENIYGAQFHPEKSHSFGKKLLKNFAEL